MKKTLLASIILMVFSNCQSNYKKTMNEPLAKKNPTKLNYHSDIVKIKFEEIVDHSGEFPELRGASGVINIDDNLGNKHIFKFKSQPYINIDHVQSVTTNNKTHQID